MANKCTFCPCSPNDRPGQQDGNLILRLYNNRTITELRVNLIRYGRIIVMADIWITSLPHQLITQPNPSRLDCTLLCDNEMSKYRYSRLFSLHGCWCANPVRGAHSPMKLGPFVSIKISPWAALHIPFRMVSFIRFSKSRVLFSSEKVHQHIWGQVLILPGHVCYGVSLSGSFIINTVSGCQRAGAPQEEACWVQHIHSHWTGEPQGYNTYTPIGQENLKGTTHTLLLDRRTSGPISSPK